LEVAVLEVAVPNSLWPREFHTTDPPAHAAKATLAAKIKAV
jgi:hypothetical protein